MDTLTGGGRGKSRVSLFMMIPPFRRLYKTKGKLFQGRFSPRRLYKTKGRV